MAGTRITQQQRALSGQRYGSFAGKTAPVIASEVLVVIANTAGATNVRVLTEHMTKTRVVSKSTAQKVAVVQDPVATPIEVTI